ANQFGCEIIGGDTIAGERLDFSITIISESKNPLTRKGLKEGQLLAYTGHLGESKRDLNRLFNGEKISDNSRFIEPVLRQKFIEKARAYLSVGMDISDGLFCDTNKLLDYNRDFVKLGNDGFSLALFGTKVSDSKKFNDIGFEPIIEISDEIGSSGEEYEMLVGFESDNLDKILEIADELDIALTIFAKVVNNGKRFECVGHHF
ncbi:hypothetical protein GSY74_05660, partial [Sulfurovum sp. bin170]|nr:hypothetical protein [Sulfurovum sp. bin170]